MKLSERVVPALVVLLLTAVLAPLCVAAGFDSCGDACCELAVRVSQAFAGTPIAADALATIPDRPTTPRFSRFLASAGERLGGPPDLLSALPLRI